MNCEDDPGMGIHRQIHDEASEPRERTTPRVEDEDSNLDVAIDRDADLEEFFDDNDANPGDRRRDPLRRTI